MGNETGKNLGEVRKKGEKRRRTEAKEAGESAGGGPTLLWQGVGD